ncbi:MAG: glycosyltransferase [Alphaproteobacteria bacterium]|nr:MAG: glycosyltransferase [Alphaproteobacteria bacterium]
MPAPISVIIPTLQAAGQIGPCIAALTEGLGKGLIRELILADGGSRDGIADLADMLGAKLVTSPPGRGGQLRAGIAQARGAWLLVLHADTVPEPGWSAAVAEHLHHHPQMAGYFRLRFDAAGLAPRLVAGWANLRARLIGLPYGDQGLLIPRALHDAVGGYPDIPLMEDVSLARALRGRLRMLPATAVTSAARYLREGWVRQGLRNWGLLLRYLAGVSPARLAAAYDRPRTNG